MAQVSTLAASRAKSHTPKNYVFQLFIIGILFFFFGFSTNANDVLMPHLKRACQLTDFQSAFVQSAFFGAFFLMSLPSAFLIQKLGYRKSIVVGLLVCAVGALLFVPAAQTRFYAYFLVALGVLASGVTLLQTAANPYVSILGPMESAPKRVSIMGVCNNAAGFLAPLIFGRLLLGGADATAAQLESLSLAQQESTLDAVAARVILPYVIIAVMLVLVAVLVFFSGLPEVQEEEGSDETESGSGKGGLFAHRNLVYGIGAIFFYVAAEVSVASFIIRYGQSLGIPDFTEEKGATYVSIYWALTGIGRLIGIFVVGKKVKPATALTFNAVVAAALILFSYNTSGLPALLAVVAIGLCHSIMWPVIFPLSIQGLGSHTKVGSSLLIMAIVGGAVFPPFVGLLSDHLGTQTAYLAMLICYLYLIFFGRSGYQPVVKRRVSAA